jgi:8-amino-7-oxononanoate synthase
LKYSAYYDSFEKQKGSRVWKDGKEMIMLSSNDYLGLTHHPRVIEACQNALKEWGSSSTGARLANGSRKYHEELEEKLADFLGTKACHISVSGYTSCMAAVCGFAQRGDLVLADKNIHSSLWSGIALSGAKLERFSHNNPLDLEDALSHENEATAKLLVIEGIYSMEGHICPLPEFLKIAAKHNCFTILDDAHGLGVLGHEGRGTASHFGLPSKAIDITCGSFSKSLASTGGFVAGDRHLVEFMKSHAKPAIFSAALSPVQVAAASTALDLLQEEPGHLERLWANVARYKAILNDLRLDTWESKAPAIPIVLGSKDRAYFFWKALKEKGVFTIISVAPGVPPGKDLIRTAISARHTEEDFEQIEEALRFAASKV